MIKIYIGPSIAGVMHTGAAFCGGFPPRVEHELKKRPFLAELIVPAEQLANMRRELTNPASRLGMLWKRAEKGGG